MTYIYYVYKSQIFRLISRSMVADPIWRHPLRVFTFPEDGTETDDYQIYYDDRGIFR